MVHSLARKHYLNIQLYPIHITAYDPSVDYLNLNINSESDSSYKWYPLLKNEQLLESCLQMLTRLSGMERKSLLLSSENILISQGSTEAIDLIIRAFCEPREEAVMVTSPTFSYYGYRAKIENVSVVDVPLQGEYLNSLNIERILATPAKVLFLCSPNNPVGTLLDLKEVEFLLQQFPGMVVIDEAYIEWTESPSVMQWVEKYDNLLVLRTFSKIWGLAGARCGITIGSKEAIAALRLVQPLFCFPDPSKEILLDKMKNLDLILHHREQMKQLRSEYLTFFRSLKIVEKVYPGEANFLFVQFHDLGKVQDALLEKNILVCDTSQAVPRTVRISLGLREEMQRLKTVLEQLA